MIMDKPTIQEIGDKIKNMEMESFILKSNIIKGNGSTDINTAMVIIKILKRELYIWENIKEI